jgi:uncharacterized membrane protein YdjX (TVP38/TMEM64 family)
MKWLQKYWKWVAVLLIVILLSASSSLLPLRQAIKAVSDWVGMLGPLGLLAYIGIYALATVLCVPGSLLTVASGLVFGLGLGMLAAWLGAVLGSTFAFLIARHLARGKIEEKIKGNQKLKTIDESIGKQGWKIIALLRLSPLIPFNASNYFYGVTAVKFWPYLLATGSGMVPGTLLYVYLGAAGKAGLDGSETQHGTLEYLFFGIGLVATIVVTVVVTRIARKALKVSGAAEEEEEEEKN